MSGKLYVVGTPIGNLEDITYRAVRILNEVDFVAAEDTRVTLKLLNHFEIKKPLVSCHEHVTPQILQGIAARISAGETCAVVSDAGMPCISDPGADLVEICRDINIPVEVVPGPTAMASAAAICGLSAFRFSFEGFLSVSPKQRREHLAQVSTLPETLIFYEAPHKLKDTLSDMLNVFGDRRCAVCRELTKIHEEVIRMTLSEAVTYYETVKPKGEFVLVIEGAKKPEAPVYSLETAVEYAREQIEQGMKPTAACKAAAEKFGFSRSEIYSEVVK